MIDPELLGALQEEATNILGELKVVIEKLESPHAAFPAETLQEFSQKIDRIMGAAKTLAMDAPDYQSLKHIGSLAELCKLIGYKAAEQKQSKLVPICAAFWSDVVSIIEEMLPLLADDSKATQVSKDFLPILIRRLEWLKAKVLAPIANQPKETAASSQAEIDKIMANLMG